MEQMIDAINGVIWSPALIYLCLAAGLFYSILTRLMQVRHFKEMIRLLFARNESPEGISSFQALTVAVAGRVGMGNIAGVAAAIGFGGPGAVFWMWIVAFLGASTAYVESTLGQIYKENDRGQYRGGPAYYFDKFFGGAFGKFYGILVALSFIISCGLFLPGVQANGVVNAIVGLTGPGEMVNTVFGEVGMNALIVTLVVVSILGLIIFGGIKRIARVAEFVVPFMALGYIIMAVLIILFNINKLPEVISLIVGDAFTAQAGFGAAIGWGIKRGVYSNEAGQGTGPHHAAAAEVQHPAQQGIVQAFSVYIDTLFVCSATAFMILMTGMYNIQGTLPEGSWIVQNIDVSSAMISTPAFTQMAVSSVFGSFGSIFVAIAVFFFSFTTIMAYYYIAETNVAYLTRSMKTTGALFAIKIVLMFAVAYGAVNSAGYIWNIGDIGVGLTAWLNIIGILLIFFMAKPAILALKDYEAQKKAGVSNYTFDPVKLGIKNATFWENRINKKD
ncbi:alanine or glycine:cation symporter, AGCS family [Moraxella cuniculi DSM 21768]|uniref:Alanine or glycine:cation symporter, AGCS family n=1 Tax=Moraxella cuniculi DSM 21768 TaxID=1122245 RepID=A0A1N7DF05_9GAMM|nr:alanine/glycine:cation symporter family protein [Moraxella cuniculi]OOS08127.1 sodium:alanine symporter [Moraxella cuniculi]SIR74430.1 alanine or glycine:cation symporter, AGCS family [Moraxella cuniculi DSM 21768]